METPVQQIEPDTLSKEYSTTDLEEETGQEELQVAETASDDSVPLQDHVCSDTPSIIVLLLLFSVCFRRA